MATYSGALSVYKTAAAATVDIVTVTGVDVTVPAAGPAAPPYAAANASRLVGRVLGALIHNRSAADLHATYGRSTPTTPNTTTPVDGQVIIPAGFIFDVDLPGESVVVKVLAVADAAYGVIAKTP